MEDCIFCKIVSGEVPSARVYEDEHCVAFLDINPVSRGHTLVIPREHYRDFLEAPAEQVKVLAEACSRVSPAVVKAMSAEGFNLFVANGRCAGQEIDHLHVHIIPRRAGDGLGLGWKAGRYVEGEIEEVRAAIAAQI